MHGRAAKLFIVIQNGGTGIQTSKMTETHFSPAKVVFVWIFNLCGNDKMLVSSKTRRMFSSNRSLTTFFRAFEKSFVVVSGGSASSGTPDRGQVKNNSSPTTSNDLYLCRVKIKTFSPSMLQLCILKNAFRPFVSPFCCSSLKMPLPRARARARKKAMRLQTSHQNCGTAVV